MTTDLTQPATPAPDRHTLQATTTEAGTQYECACRGWDAWAKGPASTRFVRRQHDDHRTQQEALDAADAADAAARDNLRRYINGETEQP